MTRVDVVITHLEMRHREDLQAATHVPAGVRVEQMLDDAAYWARECYLRVGGPWHWTDRASYDVETWAQLLAEESGEVWVARAGDEVVGYFQLARKGREVELRYFGLVEEWIGRGVGSWLLTRAVERAWGLGATRVILNTCTLDHPNALRNYLRRGFSVVREEHRQREIA